MLDFNKYTSHHRISHQTDFNHVLRNGKHLLSDELVFYYLKNQLPHSRLGILINKKNCPLAVVRNSLKRHIRESFRLCQQRLFGIDLIVVLKSRTNKNHIQERAACVHNLFTKLIEQQK